MKKIAILGGGNIGVSLAKGLVNSGKYHSKDVIITRRSERSVEALRNEGFSATTNNSEAVQKADWVVISVLPQQLNELLTEIKSYVKESQLIISVVSGVSSQDFKNILGNQLQVVRVMPNTAISIGESMTCIATDHVSKPNLEIVRSMFQLVGETVEIKEELMTSATALCACGIAFFLRSIRAASQGGIEIGFHSDDALKMAAQTAKGAAELLLKGGKHPESEIDKVTSPKGCTIAGLNEMEHQGFSSAMIKGIKTSAIKAGGLYSEN